MSWRAVVSDGEIFSSCEALPSNVAHFLPADCLRKVTSTLVDIILNFDDDGSTGANRGSKTNENSEPEGRGNVMEN